MFYCGACAEENDWPADLITPTSYGPCEVCKTIDTCFDVPSKYLGRVNNAE